MGSFTREKLTAQKSSSNCYYTFTKKNSAVETWVRESQEANHTGTGCTIKAPTAGLRP